MNTYKVTLQGTSGNKRLVYVKGDTQSSALRSDEFIKNYITGERIVNCELAKALKTFEIIIRNDLRNYTSIELTASSKSEAIAMVENEMSLLSHIVEVNEIIRRKKDE